MILHTRIYLFIYYDLNSETGLTLLMTM